MNEAQVLSLLGYGSLGLFSLATISMPLLLILDRQFFRALLVGNFVIWALLSICGSYTLHRMSQHYDRLQSARLALILVLHGQGEDGVLATDEYTTRFIEEMKALVRDKQKYTIEPATSGNTYFNRRFILSVNFPERNVYYCVVVTYPLGYCAYTISIDHSSLLGPPPVDSAPAQSAP